MIKFKCVCGKYLFASDNAAGKTGKCPHCGQSHKVPEPEKDDDWVVVPEKDDDWVNELTEEEKKQEEEPLPRITEEKSIWNKKNVLIGSGITAFIVILMIVLVSSKKEGIIQESKLVKLRKKLADKEKQIERLKTEKEKEIENLKTEIENLKVEAESLDKQIEDSKTKIKRSKESYKASLVKSETVKAEKTELISKYNELANKYNGLAKKYNKLRDDYLVVFDHDKKLVNKYNELARKYDKLRDDYLGLSDDDKELIDKHNKLVRKYNKLLGADKRWFDSYEKLRNKYNKLARDYNKLAARKQGKARPAPSGLGGKVYPGILGGGHWVSKKIDSGKYILLEDNSLWEISSLDRINTILWLMIDNITIVKNEGGIYPYKLINANWGNSAEAKYIGQK